ncbi:MCE family protein [bacterium]|nr:MCE family protein [bacterium]
MVKHFKLHIYAWIELFIWLLILGVAVMGIKIHRYHKLKELKTYQVFMPDVDGMIVGSPVKLMGVQVGYVQKIKIVNNNVYVKFVINKPDVTIPQGAIATVEFNGLGGSKSLEIVQPNNDTLASKQLIVINQPKRLHDSMLLLNDMFDKIGAIGSRSSYFMDQFTNKEESISINPATIENKIDKIDHVLDNIEKNHKDFNIRMKELKR